MLNQKISYRCEGHFFAYALISLLDSVILDVR
jgi:hypothetical protein